MFTQCRKRTIRTNEILYACCLFILRFSHSVFLLDVANLVANVYNVSLVMQIIYMGRYNSTCLRASFPVFDALYIYRKVLNIISKMF